MLHMTLTLLLIILMLTGCDDYYINVDKEAIKLEAEHLVDVSAEKEGHNAINN